ncbi:DUF5684 domain-containing protein [Microbacterium sp. NPDC091313]
MNSDSIGVVLGLTSFLLFVVLYVWMALALAALFRKAGEQGWKGWVPVLNIATVLQLGGFSPWLVLLALIPFAGQTILFVLYVISAHRINRDFGYGTGMTVLAALLGLIWASVLGFGSARWIGAGAAPAPGPARIGRPESPAAPAPVVAPATTAMPVVSAAPASWAPAPPAFGPAAAPSFGPATAPPVPPRPLPTVGPRGDDDDAVDPEDRVPPAPQRTGSFAPPVEPVRPAAPPASVAPIASVPGIRPSLSGETAGGAAVPPAPVVAPPAPVDAPEPEPWAPSGAMRSPAPAPDDTFPELSEAVSAVAGAPDAGSPRSARTSVSALYAQPEIPAEPAAASVPDAPAAAVATPAPAAPTAAASPAADDDDLDALDRTVIARRRRIPWALIPPGGSPIDLSSDVVILGRRPEDDPARPGAQLISIPDETRTVSKTHARLELRGDTWYVTDLGSTNGVLFATLMGTEVEAQPGQEIEAGERFFLGDAEVRLTRSDA